MQDSMWIDRGASLWRRLHRHRQGRGEPRWRRLAKGMSRWLLTLVISLHVLIALAIIACAPAARQGATWAGFGGGALASVGATAREFLSSPRRAGYLFFITILGSLTSPRTAQSGGVLDAVKTQQSAPAKDEKKGEKAATEKPAAELPKKPVEGSKPKDVPQ